MKAVRLVKIGQPLQDQKVSIPPVGPKEILVRIRAAGICHSDVHYRDGSSPVGVLPQTLGHEIAGVVEETGSDVTELAPGERVCVHYLLTCGDCQYCRTGHEQFCIHGKMLGKHCDGGYAEYITIPTRNAVPLPAELSFEQGAIMMCSSSTSFHALRKAELQPGETIAIFGAGGLGMSAIQLALASGALQVYAVDIHEAKLKLAATYGAIPVNASQRDPVAEIRRLTNGRGVDVALEVIGLRKTMEQAVQTLTVFGRAVMVGITDESLVIDSYRDLLSKEARITGSSDHLLWELPLLIEFARQGKLDLSQVVTRTIPLEADAINETLDALQRFGAGVRTVIVP